MDNFFGVDDLDLGNLEGYSVDTGTTEDFPNFDKILAKAKDHYKQRDSVRDYAKNPERRYAAIALFQALNDLKETDPKSKQFYNAVLKRAVVEFRVFNRLVDMMVKDING